MPEIHSTNTCFDDALDYIEHLLTSNPKDSHRIVKRYLVVHGIYRLTDLENDANTGGEPFAHAWVLDTKKQDAIQDGYWEGERITYGIAVREFYALMEKIDETRYTLEEVHRLNKLHNHYGPWEARYVALCAGKRETPA